LTNFRVAGLSFHVDRIALAFVCKLDFFCACEVSDGVADFEDAPVGAVLQDREAIVPTRQQVIVRALSRTEGNRAAAAKLLGIERRHLLRLMKCFGIQ
jgi:transcriptional regulator with GAF, ATPase, and Fis domain